MASPRTIQWAQLFALPEHSALPLQARLRLAIVQAIMGLHGGSARVTCAPAGTIRFELRFPR